MKQTDVSQLFSTPFGAQADSTTITTIPQSKPATGRASMLLGFSKDNGTPIAAGGVPPFLEDMNGILNMLASSARAAELGVLHPFSATYAEAIGGYPAGATIAHPSITGRFLICTQDGNSNNPAQSMTGWDDPIGDSYQKLWNIAVLGNYNMPAGGSAGAALWSDATGQPQYTDMANGERALALQSALQQEVTRAEGAEGSIQSALQQEVTRAEAAEAAIFQLPVGAPILWGSNIIPAGMILYDGRSFPAAGNPQLAALYPSLTVPDMRGLVPRGYDPTGTVDIDGATRGLLSFQEGSLLPADPVWSNATAITGFGQWNSGRSNLGYENTATGHVITVATASGYSVQESNTGNYGVARMKNMSWNFVARAG